MKKPLVSIIITNWNGKDHLINCLRSLGKITYKHIEIIVVDNGSTDGSGKFVKKKFPGVRVIENSKDFGFAKGNNIGVRYAKGTHVLLLNNDTLVDPIFLGPLVERMESDSSIAIVQPKIIFASNKKLQSGCSYLTATGFLYYTGFSKDPEDNKYNSATRMYAANGSCMLVRKAVIDSIGLFDESYFSYFEETDFCHRAWLAGWSVWYEPRGVIYHFGGIDNSREKPLKIQFHMYRNRINSYCKNLSIQMLLQILPVHLFVCLLYAVFAILHGQMHAPHGMFKAFVWNIKKISETLTHRRHIQTSVRKVQDADIFPSIFKNPRLSYYYCLITGLDHYRDE